MASTIPQAPIHRLHGDSLAAVFYQAVRQEPSPLDEFRLLLHVTHVCREWRVVGLDLAELWGDVAFAFSMRPELFHTILGRARSVPLLASDDMNLSVMQRQYILDHPERFRQLQSWECTWECAPLAGKHLPILESAIFPIARSGLQPEQSPLHAPILMDLSLVGGYIPFNAPNVRSLELTTRTPLQTGELIKMLRGLPKLSSLTLHESLPNEPPALRSDQLGCVELPSLHEVRLVMSCRAIETFFQLLRPSKPDASIDLYIRQDIDVEVDITRLAGALRPYLAGSTRDALRIRYDNVEPFIAYHHSSSSDVSCENIRNKLRLEAETWLEKPDRLCITLVEGFVESQISHLTIDPYGFNDDADPFDWDSPASSISQMLRMSQIVTSLQTLIWGDHATILVSSQRLADTLRTFFQSDSSTPLPKLEELTLASVWVTSLEAVPDGDGIAWVQSWLESRARAGVPLQRLRLHKDSYHDIDGMHGCIDEAWNLVRALVSVEVVEDSPSR
ncbi:unnamed protein product [Peniophora sp. CBMAI 1063]|nr:unnamed protein product [Peniophora sp. CBMAI 1063]